LVLDLVRGYAFALGDVLLTDRGVGRLHP